MASDRLSWSAPTHLRACQCVPVWPSWFVRALPFKPPRRRLEERACSQQRGGLKRKSPATSSCLSGRAAAAAETRLLASASTANGSLRPAFRTSRDFRRGTPPAAAWPRARLLVRRPSSQEIGAPASAGRRPGAEARARAAAVANVAGGVCGRGWSSRARFHALVTGGAAGGLGIQPLDRRVAYMRCRADEVVGHWGEARSAAVYRGAARAVGSPA